MGWQDGHHYDCSKHSCGSEKKWVLLASRWATELSRILQRSHGAQPDQCPFSSFVAVTRRRRGSSWTLPVGFTKPLSERKSPHHHKVLRSHWPVEYMLDLHSNAGNQR
jgi:hypothetical protein